MNRRTFIATGTATAFVPFLSGCNGDNAIAILNTVLDSATAVLKVAAANEPWVQDFANAATTLKSAEASWQAGSNVQIVISALNTLAAVAAVIPLTAVYSPLIDILVAGIDAVLIAVQPQSSPAVSPHAVKPNARKGRTQLMKPHLLQSNVGAYKEQWNKAVAANPSLAKAKL